MTCQYVISHFTPPLPLCDIVVPASDLDNAPPPDRQPLKKKKKTRLPKGSIHMYM